MLVLEGVQGVGGDLGQGEGAAGFFGFGVAVGAYGAPDRGARGRGRVGGGVTEADVFPAQGKGFTETGCA